MKRSIMLAGALISHEMSEPQRVEILKPFFTPPPQTVVALNKQEHHNLHVRKDPLAARGFITVAPPAGQCLSITRREDRPSDYICQKRSLAFRIRDINPMGQVVWYVTTKMGDRGTRLVWETPFRFAYLHKLGRMKTHYSDTVLLVDCKAKTSGRQRRLAVRTVKGDVWTVVLPDKDVLLPQPEKQANLYYNRGDKERDSFGQEDGSAEVVEAEVDAEAVGGEELSEEEATDKAKTSEQQAADKEAAAIEAARPEAKSEKKSSFGNFFGAKKEKSPEQRYAWRLNSLKTYHMSADNFVMKGVPLGKSGRCRYRYSGSIHEADVGAIECLGADGFDAIYVPVTCFGAYKPAL